MTYNPTPPPFYPVRAGLSLAFMRRNQRCQDPLM